MDPHPPFFFNGWYFVGRTATLSFIGFIALFIMLRLSGKRTLSKLNVFDFVFVVAVGSVFAASIIDKDVTLVEGCVSLAILITTQVVLAKLTVYSRTAERIINGDPTILFKDGRFRHREMRKERITEEEVRGAVREEGVRKIEDVNAVVLENDGSLTVVWKGKGPGQSALEDVRDAEGKEVVSGHR